MAKEKWLEILAENPTKYKDWDSTPFPQFKLWQRACSGSETATGNGALNAFQDDNEGGGTGTPELAASLALTSAQSSQPGSPSPNILDGPDTDMQDDQPEAEQSQAVAQSTGKRVATGLSAIGRPLKKSKVSNATALLGLGDGLRASSDTMMKALDPIGTAVKLLYNEHTEDFPGVEIIHASTILSTKAGAAQAFASIPTQKHRADYLRAFFPTDT